MYNPEPEKVKFETNVKAETLKLFEAAAIRSGKSIKDAIEEAMEKYIRDTTFNVEWPVWH